MDAKRRRHIIFRFSLVSFLLLAAFWGAVYLIKGEVPGVSSLQVAKQEVIGLPFAVSRWFDLLIGPIWSILLGWFLTSKRVIDYEYPSEMERFFACIGFMILGIFFGFVIMVVNLFTTANYLNLIPRLSLIAYLLITLIAVLMIVLDKNQWGIHIKNSNLDFDDLTDVCVVDGDIFEFAKGFGLLSMALALGSSLVNALWLGIAAGLISLSGVFIFPIVSWIAFYAFTLIIFFLACIIMVSKDAIRYFNRWSRYILKNQGRPIIWWLLDDLSENEWEKSEETPKKTPDNEGAKIHS